MNRISGTRATVSLLLLVVMLLVAPHSPMAAEAGLELYVAESGSDEAPGTAAAPFATLTQARDAIRAVKAQHGLPDGGVTVWVQDGDYAVSESLALSSEDSGAPGSPVRYRAVHPGQVRVIGGRTLSVDAFAPLREDDMARVQEAVRSDLVCVDLKALGMTAYGQFPDAFRSAVAVPELFFNDQRMTLAQWPNDGWAEIESVVESGPAPWRKHASEALGVFSYAGDRPERWVNAEAVWLEGYWCFDWACETIRIQRIDTGNRHITLAKKHVYGIGSGNPAPRRFRALNLLEELDAPGEYYLDRNKGILYFFPPESLEQARIVLSLLNDPLVQAKEAHHLAFQGITFETTSGNGLQITACTDFKLQGCTVRNTGLHGVVVEGGAACRVESCDLYDIGTCGLIIGGGDRKTLTSSKHEVLNNHIHHVSRRMRTHGYNIKLNGVGVRMAHNLIEDAPHQAIGLAGNDHIIEYNEINRVSMDSDDCGAFYMGRNPSERGNVIRYNYWHHIGSDFAHGSCAVYFDDGTGGQTVHGNVFYKASGGKFGAVFIHGGHDNVVTNNIFIDCSRAMGAAPWHAARWKEWLEGDLWQKRLHEEVAITSPIYTDRYPGLKAYMESHKTVRLNHAERNLAVKCDSLVNGNWDISQCIAVRYDPGFVAMDTQDFNLKEDAEILSMLDGFETIPFDEMGLYTDAFRQRK